MVHAMTSTALLAKPFAAYRQSTSARKPGAARRMPCIAMAASPESEKTGVQSGERAGVLPGLKNWPPQPITEHGRPKPEDDPMNFAAEKGNTQGWKRVDGPSEEELAEKRKKEREDSPWSNPKREGGTQIGGGGEGSAA